MRENQKQLNVRRVSIRFENPVLKQFLASFDPECVFAQLWIGRNEPGFELRHAEDRAKPAGNLRELREEDLRGLAQFTSSGAFRPLKSAPNLQTGWRFPARDEAQLEFALNTFYPGAIADWFAVHFASAKPTSYREFTGRQTGMYRITTMLTDVQAAPVIRACCHQKFCLKQRLWTVEGLEVDLPAEKSLIPCLEPCAILLEFARKAMRLEQQAEKGEPVPETEPSGQEEIREADFENPQNPRRLQLAAERRKIIP